LLLVIDWQGAQQLRDKLPGSVVSVFVLPPSAAALKRRLVGRGQDDRATIAKRMRDANDFIARAGDYEDVLINHALDRAIQEVAAILAAERKRRARLTGLERALARLTSPSSRK
jgi:guanylate kinase